MAAATRIYVVGNSQADGAVTSRRLVRAANSTQARNHVARETIAVRVASQDDLVALAGKVAVETAGQEQSE